MSEFNLWFRLVLKAIELLIGCSFLKPILPINPREASVNTVPILSLLKKLPSKIEDLLIPTDFKYSPFIEYKLAKSVNGFIHSFSGESKFPYKILIDSNSYIAPLLLDG